MRKMKIIPLFLTLFVCLALIGYGFSEWVFIGDIKEQYTNISGKLSMAEVVPNEFKLTLDQSSYMLTIDQNNNGETYAKNTGSIDYDFFPSTGFEFLNKPYSYYRNSWPRWQENKDSKFQAYEISVTINDELKPYLKPVITRNNVAVSNPFTENIKDQRVTTVAGMEETHILFSITFEWVLENRVIDKVDSFDDYMELITALNSTKNSDNTYAFDLGASVVVKTIPRVAAN